MFCPIEKTTLRALVVIVTMPTFQIISWDSGDIETDEGLEYRIMMYGRTSDGKSIAVACRFEPYFFVEVKNPMSDKTRIDTILQTQLGYDKSRRPLRTHVVGTSLIRRKKFFGFTNDATFPFCAIKFKSEMAMKRAKYKFQPYQAEGAPSTPSRWTIYEANLDPVLRFIHLCDIESTGWISIPDEHRVVDEKQTFCDEEYVIPNHKYVKRVELDSVCPLITCSFDIEVYSEDGSFPDPASTSNYCPVIQIANTYQRYGDPEPFKRDLFTLHQCDPIDNTEVVCCSNEAQLLKRWCKSIQRADPDILVGYNIWKFDLAFIMQRAERLNILHEINLNRLNSTPSEVYKAKFSSSAYGDNEYTMVKSIGRFQIDLLEVYKREHKLVKYSLDFVSEHFLNDRKLDMPIHEMFEKFRRKEMTEIGRYCVKDTELPLRLMQKLNDIPNLIEMAKVTYVPMNYLIERGQQIKVFSQITRQTRLLNMLVVTPKANARSTDSFVGATVLNAEKGAYMSEVVVGLDFASLYPTIMRAHNLCYNTIVLDEKYGTVPNVQYEETTIGEGDNERTYKFAQNQPGVLPKLLENLAVSRKKAKKMMAKAEEDGDGFMKNVYNGKQLAFKVSMNSIYGFCAAFMLPCQPISACVTTIGRNMIGQTKAAVEEWYPGSRVIYGDTDSVMVIFKTQTQDILKESFQLGMEAADRISKTFRQPIELEFEKCYWPYLLFSKKRYAGLMYTKPEKPDYIDAKGIQLVRRDNPDFVKTVSKTILNMIMYDRKIHESMQYAMECGRRLLTQQVPVEELTVSKAMRQGYKNENQPHMAVAKKMLARSFNRVLTEKEELKELKRKSGERVPYVFVKTDNPKDLQYQRAEDPVYVKENGIQLDVLYYLKHSLMSPICSLFELFIDNPQEELFGEMIREIEPPKRRVARLVEERVLCTGVTQAGKPCIYRAVEGESTCKRHKLI
jgi:DNA polymerase delta subunit 1